MLHKYTAYYTCSSIFAIFGISRAIAYTESSNEGKNYQTNIIMQYNALQSFQDILCKYCHSKLYHWIWYWYNIWQSQWWVSSAELISQSLLDGIVTITSYSNYQRSSQLIRGLHIGGYEVQKHLNDILITVCDILIRQEDKQLRIISQDMKDKGLKKLPTIK